MRTVDSVAAARGLEVQPATVRQLKRRGHLTPVGKDRRGRLLFDVDQVTDLRLRRVGLTDPGFDCHA